MTHLSYFQGLGHQLATPMEMGGPRRTGRPTTAATVSSRRFSPQVSTSPSEIKTVSHHLHYVPSNFVCLLVWVGIDDQDAPACTGPRRARSQSRWRFPSKKLCRGAHRLMSQTMFVSIFSRPLFPFYDISSFLTARSS